MPRYLIERQFTDGLHIPADAEGAAACAAVTDLNSELAVTWLHLYVSEDKQTTWCIYDAANAEAIRQAAQRSNLPVTRITRISVLDPYFNY